MGNKNAAPQENNSNKNQSYEEKLQRSNEEIRMLREKKFQEALKLSENEKNLNEDIPAIPKDIPKEKAPILPQEPMKINKISPPQQTLPIQEPKTQEVPKETRINPNNSDIKVQPLINYEEKFLEETFLQIANYNSKKTLKLSEVIGVQKDSFKFDDIDELLDCLLRSPAQKYFEIHEEKIEYLYNCWVRTTNSHYLVNQDLLPLKAKAQQKIYTYLTSLTLTPNAYDIEEEEEDLNDIFDKKSKIKNKLHEVILKDLDEEFIEGYFENLFKESEEADSFDIFESLVKRCFSCFLKSSLEKTKPLLTNLTFLDIILKNPKNLEFFFERSQFFFEANLIKFGIDIEKKTIFGAFLSSLSLLPTLENKVNELYFKGVERQTKQVVDKNISNVREKINEPITNVFKTFEYLVKKGKKQNVINWISLVLQKNKEKTKMYNMNNFTNSSDGFLINFTRIMILFCLPFCENEAKMLSKLDKIDPCYINYEDGVFQGNQPFNLDALNQIEEVKNEAPTNFITEIYFLTTFLLHINQKLYKNLLEFEIKLSKMHKNNPNAPEMSSLFTQKFTYETFLVDPLLVDNYIRLLSFASMLCFHFLDAKYDQNNSKFVFKSSNLEKCPEKLARMPIYLAEDMYEYLFVFIQLSPDTFVKRMNYVGYCCDFMLLMMSEKNLLNNPHLRAKFLTFLSFLVPEQNRGSSVLNQLQTILLEREFFQERLIDGLFDTFIDVEKTGSNNQFYEKFSYRHSACKIFSFVLRESQQKKYDFKSRFQEILEKDKPKFLQLMFLLLNDLIYLLDESLTRLKEIKNHEDNEQNLMNMTPQEKMEKMRIYEENKRIVSTFLLFLNSYYENLDLFSSLGQDTLILEEIREKLVNNLNYTVEALNGQNSMALKSKNMKKLHFDPKHILTSIIRLYINLGHHHIFLETIIKDQRSFNEKTFEKTIRILVRENLLDSEEIEKFKGMLDKLIAMKQEFKDNEEALGEIPEEFQDPLMMELMEDPVLLPTSNMVVDRMTIVKHLLSDPTDPFNRKPLTKEMLVPQEELKKKINEFKKQKLSNIKKE